MSDTTAVALERWSPVDALRIVVSAVALLVILLVDWLFGDDLVSFISDVLSGFRTINEDVVPVLAVVARVAILAVLAWAWSRPPSGDVGSSWSPWALGAAVGALLVTLVDGLLDASAPAVVVGRRVPGVPRRPRLPDRGRPGGDHRHRRRRRALVRATTAPHRLGPGPAPGLRAGLHAAGVAGDRGRAWPVAPWPALWPTPCSVPPAGGRPTSPWSTGSPGVAWTSPTCTRLRSTPAARRPTSGRRRTARPSS